MNVRFAVRTAISYFDVTNYEYATLRQAKWVSSQFEMCERSHNVTWTHHVIAVGVNSGYVTKVHKSGRLSMSG